MSGDVEYGRCDSCGESNELTRKYYEYPIKCECHSPQHFEMVKFCNNCEAPEEPEVTKITIKTEKLNFSKQVNDYMTRRWGSDPNVLEENADEIIKETQLIKDFLKQIFWND